MNSSGLQMRFLTDGAAVYSQLTVPQHLCGWSNIVQGGVLATVLDEIMSWPAIHLLKRIALTRTMVFLSAGAAPVPLLIFAGAFNGLILPVGVGVMLWVGARRADLLGGYRYPCWLLALGVAGWLLTIYLGWRSLGSLAKLFA